MHEPMHAATKGDWCFVESSFVVGRNMVTDFKGNDLFLANTSQILFLQDFTKCVHSVVMGNFVMVYL